MITLENWMEIQSIETEDPFEKTCRIISILADISLEEVYQMDHDVATQKALEWVESMKKITQVAQPLRLDDEMLYPIPFESLEFGAFIDIESLFTREWRQELHKLLAVLYRRETLAGDNLNPARFEEYGGWIEYRAPLFLRVPITHCYELITRYLSWRQSIFSTYEGLFGVSGDTTDDSTEGLTAEASKEIAREKRVSKWSWQLMVWRLANEDPMQMEAATMMPVLGALNTLSMYQELEITKH